MKTTSRLVFREYEQGSGESGVPRTTWEDIRRQLRRTCAAIRRNQCELDAIRQSALLRSEIRSLELQLLTGRLKTIIRGVSDTRLRGAGSDVLQVLEGRGQARKARPWCA
jgi:hypothetical protein